MRFKEFFVEQPVDTMPPPAYVSSAVPGQAASAPPSPFVKVLDSLPKTGQGRGYKAVIVNNKILWVPKDATNDQVSAAIEANPKVLDTAQPNVARTNVAGNQSPELVQAKTTAETYLGRPLADYEWDALLRVAYAEASHRPDEQAWILAAVLNSVRLHKNTVYHEISIENRMQSVTGPEGNRKPSPHFANPLNKSGLSEILAAIKLLPSVPKDIIHFTSIKKESYVPGTSNKWPQWLLAIYHGTLAKINPPKVWGKIVGDSVFTTDFDREMVRDIQNKLLAKSHNAKKASAFIPAPTAKQPVKPTASVKPTVSKPTVAPKLGKKNEDQRNY
jgi:hypothetical protein